MILRTLYRLLPIVLIILLLASVFSAVAAANTVPLSRLTDQRRAINANALKPPQCSALNLTAIVICPSTGGTCNGTDASELILGSPLIDDISGGKGDDCILGGGDDDAIRGEQNTDVCIGGPGNDSFHPSCETQIQ
jgi:hypothetical protein